MIISNTNSKYGAKQKTRSRNINFKLRVLISFMVIYFFFFELKIGNNSVFIDPNPIRVPSFSQ